MGREGRAWLTRQMHALTSSIFLPSYLPYLTLPERKALLHTYVLTCLSTAISRGRPHLNPELIMDYTALPSGPGTLPSSSNPKRVLSDASRKETQNAWMGVVQSCLFANGAFSFRLSPWRCGLG